MPWLWPALAACFLVTDAEWDEYVRDAGPAPHSGGDADVDADTDSDADTDTDTDTDPTVVGHSGPSSWDWIEARQLPAGGTCEMTGSATCGPCEFSLSSVDAACPGATTARVTGLDLGAPLLEFDDGTAIGPCTKTTPFACDGADQLCYEVSGATDWLGGCVTFVDH